MDLTIKEAGTNVPIRTEPDRREQQIAWALMALLFLVRLAYVFRYRIDSDEPQHLHTVWEWAQGLIAYRDFFDNHTPLFHIACAPLLKLLGERADVLNLMRLVMLPLYGVVLWTIYRIARQLFSPRVAMWAPLFAGAFPNFFFPSIEFRTDNLWAPVWLLAVVVFIEGNPGLLRWFLGGLLIGTGFAVSMKTSVLAGTLIGATLVAATISPLLRQKPGGSLALSLSALAGMVLVPLGLIYFLYAEGAYQAFIYCVIDHNILPANLVPHRSKLGLVWFLLVACPLWFGARQLFKKSPQAAIGTGRAVIFLQTGLFLAVMEFLWPVVTRQDYLPAYPLAVMLFTPLLLKAADWAKQRVGAKSGTMSAWSPAAVFAIELIWLCIARPLTFDGTICEVHLLKDVLRLTQPGEYVMTFKGEAVFRPRPFFYVLEPFTRERLNHGLLKDDIAERLIATNTCVTMTLTRRMPKRGEQFIWDNYIPVGQLRVAGKRLGMPAKDGDGTLKFEVKIPTTYVLLGGELPMDGLLDGTPYVGPRLLQAGPHELRPSQSSAGEIILIWSRAIERGFHPMPPDYKPERVGSEF